MFDVLFHFFICLWLSSVLPPSLLLFPYPLSIFERGGKLLNLVGKKSKRRIAARYKEVFSSLSVLAKSRPITAVPFSICTLLKKNCLEESRLASGLVTCGLLDRPRNANSFAPGSKR